MHSMLNRRFSSFALAACVAAATLLAQPAYAQGGAVVSIRAQLELAREFDPQYASAIATQEAAEQGLLGARAGLRPQVTFSASAFRSNRKEETNSFTGPVEVDRRINSHIAQVQARQPIYRKRAEMDIEQSQAELEGARELLQAADQDLQSRLLVAWVEILSLREQIQAQSRAVDASKESLLEVDRRQRSGESTLQDVEIAQARFMQAQALLEDGQAQLEIANQKLRSVAGPRAAVPDGALLQGLNRFPVQMRSAQDLIELISKSNFEVRGVRFQEDAARFEREKARSDKYPTVDAYALASKGDNDAVSSVKDEQRIGIQLSVPLYTSGAIEAAIAEADANYRRAQARTRAVTLRVEADALSANARLQALLKRVSATQRSVQAAQLMVRAMEMGVRSGVSSRAEVASAMQELANAQRQLAQLRLDLLNAWLTVEKSVSGLNPEQLERFENFAKLLQQP
jgi:outer membrane protein, protease secretion system